MKLIIFDCDGVLVDSELISCQMAADCLQDLGVQITREEVLRSYVGVSQRSMIDDLNRRFSTSLGAEYLAEVQRRTLAAFDADLEPIHGIARVLEELDLPVCVASSSTVERILHSLEVTGLHRFFYPNIFSASQVPRGKPYPDLFLFAAKSMAVAPENCVVIEDSTAGVEAACRAGMHVLGFTGGSHCAPDHADRLLAAGAARTFRTMPELPTMLQVSGRSASSALPRHPDYR